MIITLRPDAGPEAAHQVAELARRFEGVTPRTYEFEGESETVREVHLVGQTARVPSELFEGMPAVMRVVRVSTRYRLIERTDPTAKALGFEYNGLRFDDQTLHVFAGLCAVDTKEHVRQMMVALQRAGLKTTRMGAYKPRTNPYDFQGLGRECLPWVFELAGEHDIRVIAMEVTRPEHIGEIEEALELAGHPTGVMLQTGTRNAQNFELLKEVGQHPAFPVLYKRGMGITLEESLNAAEYVMSEGNHRLIFCLRGVKSHLGQPHRNLVDFAHVPVVRRKTRLLVCVDPSHSVGRAEAAPDGLPDLIHVTSQGIIAGANAVLVDFHPDPPTALCDGPQALLCEQLPPFLKLAHRARSAYEELVGIGRNEWCREEIP